MGCTISCQVRIQRVRPDEVVAKFSEVDSHQEVSTAVDLEYPNNHPVRGGCVGWQPLVFVASAFHGTRGGLTGARGAVIARRAVDSGVCPGP